MSPHEVKKWGVDFGFGNVIVENLCKESQEELRALHPLAAAAKALEGKDREEVEARLLASMMYISKRDTVSVSDALWGLQNLIFLHGAENVWIVSRCSGIERAVNRVMMIILGIYEDIGFLQEHVRFVDHYEEKVAVCKELGIEGHIDDRGEVLKHMVGVVPCLIWFNPSMTDSRRWDKELCGKATIMRSWGEIISAVRTVSSK